MGSEARLPIWGRGPARAVRLLVLPVLLLLQAIALPAQAQLKPGLELYIEKLSPETGDCGMGNLPMVQMSTLALENAGVRVLEESPMYLYVHPMVLQDNSTCFVHLDVSVRTRRELGKIQGFRPKQGWGGLLLCTTTVSGIVAREEFAGAFSNQLVQQIRICLDNLEY